MADLVNHAKQTSTACRLPPIQTAPLPKAPKGFCADSQQVTIGASAMRRKIIQDTEAPNMPVLQKSVQMVAGRLPKIIGPNTHALLDYAVAGSFLLMGAIFWRRNKRAALSSL